MTKHVDSTFDFNEFMRSLVDELRFPGMISIDAHGFVEAKDGSPVFVFGSCNSTIKLWNGEQSVFLERKVTNQDFFDIIDISLHSTHFN